MSIQDLRNQRSELSRKANNLMAEKGAAKWTAEEQTTFDNYVADMEALDRQIASIERMNNLTAEEQFRDIDRFSQSQLNERDQNPQSRAFNIFLRTSANTRTNEENSLIRNAMSTTTGSQGGYTVPNQIAPTIIEALRDYNGIRRVADSVRTETGQPMNYPTSDGTTEAGELLDQNVKSNPNDLSFGTVPLNVYKFSSKVITVPIELIQDTTVDLLGLINRRIRSRIGRAQNKFFTTGTGNNQPFGLLTGVTVKRIGATGQATTIAYDDLVELMEAIDISYLEGGNLTWNMSQALRKQIRKIKDNNGRPVWTPSYDKGISVEGADQLLGYAININNDYQAPAANAVSLTFGDHSKYMVRDALDVIMMRFDDSNFATAGQVGFMAITRAGGNLLDVNATAAYQHSAT